MAQEPALDLIKKLIDSFLSEGIKIDKAYLYGSFARNEQRKDSDIDVMLVSKEFDECPDSTFGRAWVLSNKIDPRIEPYMVGAERFETDNISPLLQIVKSEGILVS